MHTIDAQLKRPLPASFESLRTTPCAVFGGEIYLPNTCGDNTNKTGIAN